MGEYWDKVVFTDEKIFSQLLMGILEYTDHQIPDTTKSTLTVILIIKDVFPSICGHGWECKDLGIAFLLMSGLMPRLMKIF